MSDLTLDRTPARLAAAVTHLIEKSENEATRGQRDNALLFAGKAVEAARSLHELAVRAAMDAAALPRSVAS